LKIKKELVVFALSSLFLNAVIFSLAGFLFYKIEGCGYFCFLILFTLFLFSTLGFIYLAYELLSYFSAPLERFKILIENTIHELNTPVATIKTNTLMLKKTNDENICKKANRIELACARLSELYEDLEYFAKKETKSAPKTEVSLKSTIESELALFEEKFGAKQITLSISLEDSLCIIDQKGFKIALSNLFSNSLKFTNPNGKITVSLKGQKLTVFDTGKGIAKDELIKIFDRYYQEAKNSEGCGIGLFLVKEFCDENGVELFIRSEVGVGSEFTLDFGKIRKKF
jgi:two-component system OmpR family sensor kinase